MTGSRYVSLLFMIASIVLSIIIVFLVAKIDRNRKAYLSEKSKYKENSSGKITNKEFNRIEEEYKKEKVRLVREVSILLIMDIIIGITANIIA